MRICFLSVLTLSLVTLLPTPLLQAAEPIAIGSRLELFVDDLLIESMTDLRLQLHHPVKAPRPKSPLPLHHMVTVIRDGDLFRAWYRGSDAALSEGDAPSEGAEVVHYLESDDGHEWRAPVLGLHEVNGSRENNVILARMPRLLHNFMPFLDRKPGVAEAERFKALSGHPGPGNKEGLDKPGHGLVAWTSADGIHWINKGEVIPYRPQWRHAFDSPNVSFWSEAEQLYVCYFRTWTIEGRLRSVSRVTSPDFVDWSAPVALDPNLPKEHLYTTMTTPYERAPHIYVAFPTRFVPGRGNAPGYDKKDMNVTDVLFMTTRAGSTQYQRTFKEAFIRPGLDPKRWINRGNYVAQGIHFLKPEELSIYHRSGDRYILRTDGFVSVHAGSQRGELRTQPVIFEGRELVLNFSTSAVGGVRVELQDAAGKALPGFALKDCVALYGDSIEQVFSWKNSASLAALAGQPVRLRFELQDADLYSFCFR